MYYNFYVYLFILAVAYLLLAFNKGKILKDISVTNDIFYTSLVIVILVELKKMYEKDSFFPKISNGTKKRLALQCVCVTLGLFIGGIIIIKENFSIFN